MIQIIKKMPTEKIYKKIIEVSQELINLGLNCWGTELTITDKKKKIKTDVKVVIKLKTKKLKKEKLENYGDLSFEELQKLVSLFELTKEQQKDIIKQLEFSSEEKKELKKIFINTQKEVDAYLKIKNENNR